MVIVCLSKFFILLVIIVSHIVKAIFVNVIQEEYRDGNIYD